MPFPLLFAPLMMLQVDPITGMQTGPSALPEEIIEKKANQARKREQDAADAAASAPLLPQPKAASGCIDAVDADPEQAVDVAEKAMSSATGAVRVRAGMCLGQAYTALDQWPDAQRAFTQARDAADASDHASRARLGAMAGNAALAANDPTVALALLGDAETDAKAGSDGSLVTSIDLDRARALVAVGQPVQAGVVLAERRQADPNNAQVWLLSATLSRRLGNLAEAQTQIEKAGALSPPKSPYGAAVGLEAGAIAMLSKHEDAARKSWQSVIQADPDSDEAQTARDYLSQLDQIDAQGPATSAAAAKTAAPAQQGTPAKPK
ncbi:hypothetical protein [Novosphingobium sp. 9]|uniref:hypothetical protein n=1 Tax=Novosphingobium sp. 9 TaxID=2025349 RepID=UPI0021B57143|nr:hypothetical protein [Novosphingobium sp. 9]